MDDKVGVQNLPDVVDSAGHAEDERQRKQHCENVARTDFLMLQNTEDR
jgi:hypothetical protein